MLEESSNSRIAAMGRSYGVANRRQFGWRAWPRRKSRVLCRMRPELSKTPVRNIDLTVHNLAQHYANSPNKPQSFRRDATDSIKKTTHVPIAEQ